MHETPELSGGRAAGFPEGIYICNPLYTFYPHVKGLSDKSIESNLLENFVL